MKLRIIKGKKDEFIPQYLNPDDILPAWRVCKITNDKGCLITKICHSQEDAIEIIENFKKQHPKPEIVWEGEY